MSVKLLKDLDFANKLNSVEAVSEAGKDLLKNYRGHMYTNPASCSVVNGFIKEASQYGFDTGLVSILESVKKFISENNISWKLASACESIMNNNSTFNTLSKLGVEQVEKLLEMNEKDVVAYIKAGSLKNIQYVPEFRTICREVYKQHINEAQAVNYNVVNPVSYIYECENEMFFSVMGKTFKVSEGKVSESQCDDQMFNEMNNTLQNFRRDGNSLVVEAVLGRGEKVKFTLSNDDSKTVNITKSNINETFNDSVKFLNYCDTLSRTMFMNEKLAFINTATMVNKVFEALDSICVLDTVKLINSGNMSVCAIVEGKDNVNLTVFHSVNYGKSSKNYDYVAEALNDLVKVSGINLSFMYEDRINEECKKSEEYNVIKEQVEENKKAQMQVRKEKIRMLAEQYKNDPVRLMLLNRAAREVALLESVNS